MRGRRVRWRNVGRLAAFAAAGLAIAIVAPRLLREPAPAPPPSDVGLLPAPPPVLKPEPKLKPRKRSRPKRNGTGRYRRPNRPARRRHRASSPRYSTPLAYRTPAYTPAPEPRRSSSGDRLAREFGPG